MRSLKAWIRRSCFLGATNYACFLWTIKLHTTHVVFITSKLRSQKLQINFTSRLALEHRPESVFVSPAALVDERFAFLLNFVVSEFAERFVASSSVDFVETASCKIVHVVISLVSINYETHAAMSNCFRLCMSLRTRSSCRNDFQCRHIRHRWI